MFHSFNVAYDTMSNDPHLVWGQQPYMDQVMFNRVLVPETQKLIQPEPSTPSVSKKKRTFEMEVDVDSQAMRVENADGFSEMPENLGGEGMSPIIKRPKRKIPVHLNLNGHKFKKAHSDIDTNLQEVQVNNYPETTHSSSVSEQVGSGTAIEDLRESLKKLNLKFQKKKEKRKPLPAENLKKKVLKMLAQNKF